MAIQRLDEQFKLQFDPGITAVLANRYSYPREARIVDLIGPSARHRGYYTREEFLELCRWKTPRSQPLVARNPREAIEEATRLALSTESELLRIKIPMALEGVSWPTASVVLHFAHQDPYPIMDFRALESFGLHAVRYTFPLWKAYVRACRLLAKRTGLDMRSVDRALWQWSKERSTQ